MSVRRWLFSLFMTLLSCVFFTTAWAQEDRPNRVLLLDGDGDYVEMAESEILNDIGSQVTMEIAGESITANTVGGDFFDYLELPDGKVGIAIADVSGKGLRAAMNATMANGMMHEVATSGIDSALSCREIIDAILKDVTDFTGSAEQYDDMTIVAIKKL